MAKDGSMRGGQRSRSGPAKKDAATKLIEGKKAKVIPVDPAMQKGGTDIPVNDRIIAPDNIDGEEMPPVDEWINEKQFDGEPWSAAELTKNAYDWLKTYGCHKLITRQQLYGYAVSAARWVQCQRGISKYGFLAKHPTTGAPIESPYVKMAEKFFKSMTAAWFGIFQIVKENCTTELGDSNPYEQMMNDLLAD